MDRPVSNNRENTLRHILKHVLNVVGLFPQLRRAFADNLLKVIVDVFKVGNQSNIVLEGTGKGAGRHVNHDTQEQYVINRR